MKKFFIFFIALLCSGVSFGQRIHATRDNKVHTIVPSFGQSGNPYARTTATGDTATLTNIQIMDTLTMYSVGKDSGYVTGPNYWNDKAFAERYTNDSGSNMQVIGITTIFVGKVNPASTHSVVFKIWDQGAQQMVADTLAYNGFPNNVLDTLAVPVTQIGIGPVADTIKSYFFDSATGNVTSFYAGYSIDYSFSSLNGDTIGLLTTKHGDRTGGLYTFKMSISDLGDTSIVKVLNVQNATLGSDNVWYDNYTQNDSLLHNLAIYPIVAMGFPVQTKGITKNGLTFSGNYPNPATDHTNIMFSLASGKDVTIYVTDLNGRMVTTIRKTGLPAGAHSIRLDTDHMPAGECIYLVRTSDGDGIAGKLVVSPR